MRRNVLVAVAFGALALGPGLLVGKTMTVQTVQAPANGTTTLKLDASWPKLPANWKLGYVVSVAVDTQDHVWVLHRAKTLSDAEISQAPPPVLEFDAAGNFVQAWGGPGSGYEWPEREHGIYIDHKGNVWLGGNNYAARQERGLRPVSDDQLLKFTKSGTLIMQIGHSDKSHGNDDTNNLNQPADAFVYQQTNEVFIADGYGNHRVIVLDADTGAFKRMWGAFGNKPLDTPPRGRTIPAPVVADDGSPGPQQFDIVHAVKVSNDGLVYVADRENKRLQVFTIEGKYRTQAFFRRTETLETRTTASLAFSPGQEFLYLGGMGANPQILVVNRTTLQVVGSIVRSDGFEGAHHMAADSKGNIYVANGNVRKFAVQGGTTLLSR
jgi:DNA-binding beta-propeller fold protein YncE